MTFPVTVTFKVTYLIDNYEGLPDRFVVINKKYSLGSDFL